LKIPSHLEVNENILLHQLNALLKFLRICATFVDNVIKPITRLG